MSEDRENKKLELSNILNRQIKEKYIGESHICDKTFSNRSDVVYIPEKELYIKIAQPNYLENEYKNTVFFNQLGVAGEVIDYIQDDNRDYLVVKEIKGQNGISEEHMINPKKLAFCFGEHLRMIHSLKYEVCPSINRTKELFRQCNVNVREDKLDMDLFFKEHGFTPNQGLLMLDSFKKFSVEDVYLHGDYYLPNIIMNNYEFSGIIDLDCSGVGDRHIDIISGLRSLEINFRSKEYEDTFLDGYGRDIIDKDRLAFAKILLMLT